MQNPTTILRTQEQDSTGKRRNQAGIEAEENLCNRNQAREHLTGGRGILIDKKQSGKENGWNNKAE